MPDDTSRLILDRLDRIERKVDGLTDSHGASQVHAIVCDRERLELRKAQGRTWKLALAAFLAATGGAAGASALANFF